VQHPGLFPYSREFHPLDYITLAGGATRTGIPSSARVLRRSGGSQKLKDVAQIEPGDVISVPEAIISPAEWVQIVLILANLGAATAVLVITLRR
jgi:protein involved in polysaccharide export with SLBB domain